MKPHARPPPQTKRAPAHRVEPKGKLVAVVTHGDGAGRNTLMKLLAHRSMPTEGHVFAPTHLRALHVSCAPMLLPDTLWRSLAVSGGG